MQRIHYQRTRSGCRLGRTFEGLAFRFENRFKMTKDYFICVTREMVSQLREKRLQPQKNEISASLSETKCDVIELKQLKPTSRQVEIKPQISNKLNQIKTDGIKELIPKTRRREQKFQSD